MDTQTVMNKSIQLSAKNLARAGILAGIAIILTFIEFPLPFLPPFLKLDFSNVPILIGSFAFGPVVGILIALIKDLICLVTTTSGGVGQLADFLTTIALVVPSAVFYSRTKNRKYAMIGMVVGILLMTIIGALANKFILIPFYANIMPLETIFEICGKINPLIHDIDTYALYGAAPFNFIKATILCGITLMVYKKISKILHK